MMAFVVRASRPARRAQPAWAGEACRTARVAVGFDSGKGRPGGPPHGDTL